ncbi:mucin-2-like [Ylistrum balloti]|uniref:mucin-2-like n=1 Tax=Ylistrum balloti TaxID=509963 RepID=UPI002905F6CD|nr:mucin-2-like [Ylistrum balloti]
MLFLTLVLLGCLAGGMATFPKSTTSTTYRSAPNTMTGVFGSGNVMPASYQTSYSYPLNVGSSATVYSSNPASYSVPIQTYSTSSMPAKYSTYTPTTYSSSAPTAFSAYTPTSYSTYIPTTYSSSTPTAFSTYTPATYSSSIPTAFSTYTPATYSSSSSTPTAFSTYTPATYSSSSSIPTVYSTYTPATYVSNAQAAQWNYPSFNSVSSMNLPTYYPTAQFSSNSGVSNYLNAPFSSPPSPKY